MAFEVQHQERLLMLFPGSRGIGLHTATAFLRAGAERVILVARKLEGPQGLLSALEALARSTALPDTIPAALVAA